jgi:BirA family biotin operon repressor/biotin-[acetyl-CoA-carboxylase] ligase
MSGPGGTLWPGTRPLRALVAPDWELATFDSVDSTNLAAAGLPAWHAIRARTQTKGRGRFQRRWVSDSGGLWLSAVVPLGDDRTQNQVLPLVAGLSLIMALGRIGILDARLRWPNDVMVGERKLAGLLVDCFSPRLAVVGMGLNVTNRPSDHDASLVTSATRLADIMEETPDIDALAEVVLSSLRSEVELLLAAGFGALSSRINRLWGPRRRVRLHLDHGERTGTFIGVDKGGRLLLEDPALVTTAYEPHEVRLLRET